MRISKTDQPINITFSNDHLERAAELNKPDLRVLWMINIFIADDLFLDIWIRALKCHVWYVPLYGCKTWTLKINMINRLVRLSCSTTGGSWKFHTAKKSNVEILQTMRKRLETIVFRLKNFRKPFRNFFT